MLSLPRLSLVAALGRVLGEVLGEVLGSMWGGVCGEFGESVRGELGGVGGGVGGGVWGVWKKCGKTLSFHCIHQWIVVVVQRHHSLQCSNPCIRHLLVDCISAMHNHFVCHTQNGSTVYTSTLAVYLHGHTVLIHTVDNKRGAAGCAESDVLPTSFDDRGDNTDITE